MKIKLGWSQNKIGNILMLLSISSMMITIYFSIIEDTRYPFWILSFVYAIGINLIKKNNIVSFNPGIITLNIVMFCRYSILPLFLCMTNELSRFAIEYERVEEAVWLMVYELVFILIALFFSGKKYGKKQNINREVNFHIPVYGTLVALMVFVIVGVISVRYGIFSNGLSLILKGSSNVTDGMTEISGAIAIVWQAGLAWIYIYLCMKLKQKDCFGRVLFFVVLILSAGYILLTFIGQTSISRWYTVVSFVAVYFTLIKLFPQKMKIITMSIAVPVAVLIVIVSVYKNSSFLSGNVSFKTGFLELFDVSTLDSYFAGPVSVNNAILLNETTDVGFFSLFLDAFNNMPIVNHWVDLSNSTLKMYVQYMHRGDQIVPLVGQSAIYFSYLFAPLLSVLVVWIARKFDYLYTKSTTAMFFVYGFTATWVSLSLILNLAITLSWFYIRIIPLMLLIKIVEGMGMKNIRKRCYGGNEQKIENI